MSKHCLTFVNKTIFLTLGKRLIKGGLFIYKKMEQIETDNWEEEFNTMIHQGYYIITMDDRTYWIKDEEPLNK